MLGGFFSGKYLPNVPVTSGRFNQESWSVVRSTSAYVRQGKMYQARYFKDHYFKAIEIIRPVAEKHGLTLLEVALRWMIHHSQLDFPKGDGVIIGCSSVEQLESNLTDFGKGPLPEEVVAALDVSRLLSDL